MRPFMLALAAALLICMPAPAIADDSLPNVIDLGSGFEWSDDGKHLWYYDHWYLIVGHYGHGGRWHDTWEWVSWLGYLEDGDEWYDNPWIYEYYSWGILEFKE